MMLKSTGLGDSRNRSSTGRKGMAAPIRNMAILSQRAPARLWIAIQSSSTGATAAVSKEEAAAAPASSPAAAAHCGPRRSTEQTARRKAATERNRNKPQAEQKRIGEGKR